MNQLDTFNSLNPYEQCEWIVQLIDNGSEPNVILYQDLEKLRDNKITQILN
jgi:hypothetical protein